VSFFRRVGEVLSAGFFVVFQEKCLFPPIFFVGWGGEKFRLSRLLDKNNLICAVRHYFVKVEL